MAKEQVTNFLIPEHRKLNEKEVKEILVKYSIKDTTKLPKIKKSDPALRGFDAVVGDVIAIQRTSFAGKNTYYRAVVD